MGGAGFMTKRENAQVIVVLEGCDWKQGFGNTIEFKSCIPFRLCKKARDIYEDYSEDFYDMLKDDKEFEGFLSKASYYDNFYELLYDNMVGREKVTYYENGEEVTEDYYNDNTEGGFYHWGEDISVVSISTREEFSYELCAG